MLLVEAVKRHLGVKLMLSVSALSRHNLCSRLSMKLQETLVRAPKVLKPRGYTGVFPLGYSPCEVNIAEHCVTAEMMYGPVSGIQGSEFVGQPSKS